MNTAARSYALSDREASETTIGDTPKWFACDLSRQEIKALVRRDDWLAGRHFAIWLLALVLAGTVAFYSWGSWWALPAFLLYGIVYNSADSKWHDLSHGTPFKTRWINEALYVAVSFMTLREPVRWRWSHARHHTYTILVGQDPEIAATRPPHLAKIVSGLWYLAGGFNELKTTFQMAAGRITPDARIYVPQSEWLRMILMSRLFLAFIGCVIAACMVTQSVLPAMFVGLPRFYGSFLHYLQAFTQHAGLAEDVLDYRLNTRTVLMNPVLAFLYTNMNYHVEHHMFATVPFYRLRALHERVKSECPPAYRGLWETYREIVSTLLRQARDPSYFVVRPLPDSAPERGAGVDETEQARRCRETVRA